MNKWDWIFILFCLGVSLLGIFFVTHFGEMTNAKAVILRKNRVLLEVPLEKEEKKYQVEGKLGMVDITVKDYGVMVEKENSPKHLCSRQGYITKPYESIVCLPNEIVVKIVDEGNLDTVVK